MVAKNIKWCIDEDEYTEEENEDLKSELPTEMEIPEGMTDEDDISDWLSDKTGFCHDGFEIVD